MEIIQVVGLGLLGTVLVILLREYVPEFSLQLSLLIGLLIFILILERVMIIVDSLENIASRAGVDLIYLDIILKIVGISYIAEFGAQLCRDAKVGIIANKIELAGKILIISLGIPIMLTILESIMALIPQ